MPNVLVLANETIGGAKLLDAVRERAGRGDDVSFHVVVPQTKPRHGNVIYDDVVRDSAQVRVDLALEFLSGLGVAGAAGEVGDADPFNAARRRRASRSSTSWSTSPRRACRSRSRSSWPT